MIPGHVRIFLCVAPIDMRLGFDRLAQAVRERLGQDPEGGSMFIFAGRRPTRLKVLWYERHGYCVLYKRLHRAVFALPSPANEGATGVVIDAAAFAQLLAGIPHERGHGRKRSRATK